MLAVPAHSAPAQTLIQPGARISTPVGGCTLNFVFADASGAMYVGTAGHCVRGPGDWIRDGAGAEIGTVVYSVFHSAMWAVSDFALIAVHPDRYPDVQASMRYWGGPTGVIPASETSIGDEIMVYGYGIVLGSTEPTRPRPGVLIEAEEAYWRGEIPIIFGDSGGPILHGSGRALGIVTGITGHSMIGMTVERALRMSAEAGYDIALVTAPLESPI